LLDPFLVARFEWRRRLDETHRHLLEIGWDRRETLVGIHEGEEVGELFGEELNCSTGAWGVSGDLLDSLLAEEVPGGGSWNKQHWRLL
jgi:hypothetical protein